MKVLLTGAFGNVGLSTVEELLRQGHTVTAFELDTKRNRKLARKYAERLTVLWGDLRDAAAVQRAVEGQEVVLHVGAIIPPLADEKPELAEAVNVGGTANVVAALARQPLPPKLVFTSSIAVYGDRRAQPMISTADPLNPHDPYSRHKVRCEALIRDSALDWLIVRLTFIVSQEKLQMDPLLFDVPLETCIEICDTKDVGLALANAVGSDAVWGKTLNIAGGERCRTTFGAYVDEMMELFGLGRGFLPPEAFSTADFHCGYMDTAESQALLQYQRCTLDEYYAAVRKTVGGRRALMRLLRPVVRRYLLKRSPHYRAARRSSSV